MSLMGSCHCGYVRYSVDQDDLTDVANCHCSICRRSTGGTFVTWATVPRASLTWTAGAPGVYPATESSRRYYCPRCGAQLALHTELAPQTIDITVSTLERVDDFPPCREIWVKNKIKWVMLDNSLVHEDEESL
jgi:hypothetical protein